LNENRARTLLPLFILIAILAVSTASIFIRFAQGEGVPSLVIAAYRLTIASLVLAPIAMIRHRMELCALTRKELLLGLLSGIFLALHFATWITSLEYTTVASSVVLVSTSPLWVALLGPVFVHEKPTVFVILGMILALIGGTVIALSDACTWEAGLACPSTAEFLQGKAMWGNFLALAGAWTVTGYLLIGRRLRAKISLVPYIFIVYGIAAVVLIVILLASGKPFFGYTPIAYLWLFLLAFIPQLIGHSTYNWALRYMPAAFVAVTTLGEPIGSTILAFIILQEQPGWIKIVGGIFILAGIYLAGRVEKQRQ
jgi:drug/metabolite transporter (DMT)-like permease